MAEQRAKKKNHEGEEHNLRDSSRRGGNSRESEKCRDQCDDEKSQTPLQHFPLLRKIVLDLKVRNLLGVWAAGLY